MNPKPETSGKNQKKLKKNEKKIIPDAIYSMTIAGLKGRADPAFGC